MSLTRLMTRYSRDLESRLREYRHVVGAVARSYHAAKAENDRAVSFLPMLEGGLRDRPDDLNDNASHRIVKDVMALYSRCKHHSADLSAPYQVGGEWATHIAERRRSYDILVCQEQEEIRALLANFWRNELGAIVANYDYYPHLASGNRQTRIHFLNQMLRDYEVWKHYVCDDTTQLRAPTFGNAWGLYIEDTLVVPQAFRFHRNASFILELLGTIAKPVVAEIGGGYGGMAYYLLSQNNRLTYLNFDIPETLFLAAFYLAKAFPDRKIFWFSEPSPITSELIERYDILLMPHYALQRLEDLSVHLFHNAISLSEMSSETISEYVRQIQRTTRHYFYHVNIDRVGIMNKGYERVPASRFPIDTSVFRKLLRTYDPYFGPTGPYCEFLYQRG